MGAFACLQCVTRVVLVISAALSVWGIAFAEPSSPSRVRRAATSVKKELHRYTRDAVAMSTEPLRWDSHEWKRMAEGAAVIGAVRLGDQTLYDAVQRNRSSSSDQFAEVVVPMGGRDALILSGVMMAAGEATHRPSLRNVGRDSLEAELWAAGVVTPALKYAFGRARPIDAEGVGSFHPFSNSFESFPSGHATNAFALATVLAEHYRGTWVPLVAYAIASGVAYSRMNDQAHFPSDVVAGALIGRAIGRSIVARHRRISVATEADPHPVESGPTLTVAPLVTRYGEGLLFSYSW